MNILKQIQKGKKSSWPKKVIIYTDGASRGNPGPSAGALAVYNTKHTCLYETAFSLGLQTNNFAEYTAVIMALKISAENHISHLLLKSDSEFLIKQLTGLYKVKSQHIKTLYQECKKWEQKISKVTYEHVRREYNKRADELANLILDDLEID